MSRSETGTARSGDAGPGGTETGANGPGATETAATGPGGATWTGGDDVSLGGIGFLLGVAHRAHRRRWEATLADLEVSAPQAAMLRLIAAEPGQGIRALARRLGTDPMNAQRIAESLIAAGLCQAGRDPGDARRRPLRPSARGRRVARSVVERAGRSEQILAAALGEQGYTSLVAGLRALIDHDHPA